MIVDEIAYTGYITFARICLLIPFRDHYTFVFQMKQYNLG